VLVYIAPPILILVIILASKFQERVAWAHDAPDKPFGGRGFRIVRAAVHGFFVLFLGVVSPFLGGGIVKGLSLPDSSFVFRLLVVVASTIVFSVPLTAVDKVLDWFYSSAAVGPDRAGAESIRLRELLVIELPDVVLFFFVASFCILPDG
jgi:hypothetical protein